MTSSLQPALTVVALGIIFDVLAKGQRPGMAAPLFVAVFVASVAGAMRLSLPRSRSRDALLAASVVVGALVPLRGGETLALLNIGAATALLTLAATGGGVFDLTLARLLARIVVVLRSTFRVPAFITAPLRAAIPRPATRHVHVALRAAAFALPVVGVFAILLGTADPVFADVLLPDLSLRVLRLADHVLVIGLGIAFTGTLWVASSAVLPDSTPVTARTGRARLRFAEWGAVLSSLTALFAVFVIVQMTFLFSGRQRVQVTPGFTYAEYARQGFFQLLVAGGLTAVIILGAWDWSRRDSQAQQRVFKILITALVSLCMVILASAAVRLALYQQAFGFTMARLAAWFAIGCVGAILAVLAGAVWWDRRRIVLGASGVIVLCALVAANLLNPGAFVASRNIDRFRSTGKIDAGYLTFGLGHDAVPALVALLPSLKGPDRTAVRNGLCMQRHLDDDLGWRSWNLARERAKAAFARFPATDCPQ